MDEKYTGILKKRGINPTANRIYVLKQILHKKEAFSLLDLETELDTIDKSTLFRTLTLFEKNRLIHSIDDGTGSFKYAVCDEECECTINQLHVHFYCTECKRTFCFRETPIQTISLPAGFVVNNANYVLKGVCARCAEFAT